MPRWTKTRTSISAFIAAMALAALVVAFALFLLWSDKPFDHIQQKLAEGGPATILVWSDSTGNGDAEPREWPYLLGDWLAQRYPTSPIHLTPWSEAEADYAETKTIAEGSGGPAITIANFAVPGANMAYGIEHWQKAFGRWREPDIIIVNLGLNYAGYEDIDIIRPLFEEGLDRLVADYPDVPTLLVKQNPFSDNDTMDLVYQVIDDAARHWSLPTADVGTLFKAHSDRDLFLGNDNTHPNQDGQDLYLDAIAALW